MKVWNAAGKIIDWLQRHSPTHEDGGVDEIDLTGLSGKTAELTTHETVTNAPTGFPNRDSVLSFTGVTFTITPDGSGSFDYYIAGVKYTKSSADNLVIADETGPHWIYYDGSTLSENVDPTHAEVEDLIQNKALVAIIYWQTTGAGTGVAPLLADERHGATMSGKTHLWIHETTGATYHNGLTLSDYIEDTDSDVALTFKLTNGGYFDEDLEHAIIDGDPTTQYSQQLNTFGVGDASIPVVYKVASGVWVQDAASTLPYKLISANNRLAYNSIDVNGNGSQVEVGDKNWVSMTLIATNDWQYPIKAIQGQNEYTDKKTAVEQATAEVISFGGGELSPEVLTLYRFVMRTDDNYSGTKKAKIEVDGVTDFRTSSPLGVAAVATDHGALGGLADDDHAQYILHSLADAANDFLIASGDNAYAKQTLAQTLTTLGKAAASGLASLNASTKVVEQPASISDHLDDTEHGTDAETSKAPTSNRLYDHDVATTGVHGAGANTLLHSGDIASSVQAYDAGLTNLAAVAMAANKFYYTSGDNVHIAGDATVAGRAMLAAATAAAQLALMTTAIKAELDLLDLAGLTAGQLLVATAATTAAWQSTGVTLTAPVINGIVTTTGLSLPAFIALGRITLTGAAIDQVVELNSRTNNVLYLIAKRTNADAAFYIQTTGVTPAFADTTRLIIYGRAAEVVAAWQNIRHTGIKLGGALDANSQDINNVAAPGAAGDPLIKGTRVTTTELPAMTDEKIWKGTGANVEEIDVPTAAGYGRLTVEGFQLTPSTGTSLRPVRLNDLDFATTDEYDQIGEYAQVILPAALHITQYRTYGQVSNNGDGTFKLEYMDIDGDWNDWVTGISTRAASWSNWTSNGDVVAIAIRMTATSLDTAANKNYLLELEVKY